MRESKTNFVNKADTKIMPTITKRLGVGLAAAVKAKLAAQKQKQKEQLSDDGSFYDSEDDRSENKRPGEDSDSYYNENTSEKIGKGFDSDNEIDLTEFTEQEV
jgi:hypothetical protein